MKEICLIWSRGRHFSPSLPDQAPTGIWNSVYSISDPRAEISGILVMVRRSSATSRSTTYWFKLFRPESRNFDCACTSFPNWSAYHNCRRKYPDISPRQIWISEDEKKKSIKINIIVYNLNNTYGYTRQPLWNLVLDLGNGVVCIFHIFGRQCYASSLRRHRRW